VRVRRAGVRRAGVRGALVRGALVLSALVLGALVLGAQAPSAPKRIISIVPAVTEMLYAMGAGPQVVGVSSFDHFPPAVETLPRVGGLIDPDFERILQLKPDLVIVYGSQTDLIAKLSSASVPIYSYRHAGLADVMATIRALGQRVGRRAEGEAEATRIERGLDAIRARVAGQPRYRTLLIFGREPGDLRGIYASGGFGFLHDLLEVAGGTDVFADVKRESIQISSEQVIAKAPEAVVELHGDMTPANLAVARAAWNRVPGVPAVKQNRVYLLSSEMLTIPGPRVVDAARMIADALHPAVKR
jgi:iron complex transport system substrate-binding protein